MKYLDQITFTRFVCVLLVLFSHGTANYYFSLTNSHHLLNVLDNIASAGVAYLYTLSGFVLTFAYFRPDQSLNLSKYFRARLIRIYPLYLIAFLLMCFYYRDAILNIKPQKILANIFILQAWISDYSQSFNYPAWSVTVEVLFYLIFPFFIRWAHGQSTRFLIIFALVIWTISQVLFRTLWIGYFPIERNFILYFPIFHISTFLMGVVAGIWYLREGMHQKIKTSLPVIVFIGSIIFAVGYYVLGIYSFPFILIGFQTLGGLLAPIATIGLIALVLDKSKISIVFSGPIFVALGEGAYALYILHIPIAWNFEALLENLSPTNAQQIFDIFYLPLMIAISVFSHYIIDVPLRARLTKVTAKINIPLLLIDLIIIAFSVYFSFRLRFNYPREYASYREIGRLIFYSAFFIRPVLSIIFKTFNSETFKLPLVKLISPLLISTTIGSVVIAIIAYIGYVAGLSVNFPRSIFLIDWLIIFSFSLLIRLAFPTIPASAEREITSVR